MSQAQATPGDNLEAGVVGGINGNTGAVRAPYFFSFLAFAQRSCTEDPSNPPSQPAQNDREKERESNFLDGSDHFFTMYTEKTGEYDKKMTERWQADADGILVFVSLYCCLYVVPLAH